MSARRFCDALAGAALWSVVLVICWPGLSDALYEALTR